jgi:hypothetical protein
MYFNIGDVEKNAEMFAAVCSRIVFLPLRVEARMDIGMYEVTGLSSHFDRIASNGEIPAYRIDFSDDGKKVSAIRIGTQRE